MATEKDISEAVLVTEPSDDLRRRSILALGKTSVLVLLDRTIQIAALAITARLLLPTEIAVVAAGGAVISLLGAVSTMGMPAFLIQVSTFTPKIQAATRGALVVSVGVVLALAEIAAPLIGEWFQNPQVADALRVMALVLVAPIFTAPALAKLSRDLRAKDVALADLIANTAGIALVTVPMALMQFGFWSLAYGALAQISLRSLILNLMARQSITFSFDLAAGVDVIRRSGGYMMNNLLTRFEVDAPHWIVGRYLPVADLGLFSRASSLMNYPAGLFYAVVDRVIFPAVALVQDNSERARAGALDAVKLTAIVGIPLAIFMYIFSADIVRVALGPNWEGAIEPFKLLCVASYCRLANRLHCIILLGLGKAYQLAIVQTAFLLLLVVACALSVQNGLGAVAEAVSATTFLGFLVTAVMAMRASGLSVADWIMAHRHSALCSLLATGLLAPLMLFMTEAGASSMVILASGILVSLVAGALAVTIAPMLFLGPAGVALLKPLTAPLVRILRRGRP